MNSATDQVNHALRSSVPPKRWPLRSLSPQPSLTLSPTLLPLLLTQPVTDPVSLALKRSVMLRLLQTRLPMRMPQRFQSRMLVCLAPSCFSLVILA
jgi:hypothetical protein